MEEGETEPNRKNNVRLAIRKVQFAPSRQGPQPTQEVQQDFILSNNPITLEATLDKELYYHGETLNVNVQITNNSNRAVKKIKISVRQFADICLYSSAQYKCQVASIEQDTHVPPSSTMCRVFQITPRLSDNKDKRGLALDGQLKHEDTNLASTTICKEGIPREHLGIVVSYKVKVKLLMNGFGGDVSLCLPFSLMHSKPTDDSDNQRGQNAQNARTIRAELKTTEPQPPEPTAEKVNPKIEEPNLITFDDPSSSKFVQPPPNPAVLQGAGDSPMQSNPEAQNQIPAVAQHAPPPPGPQPGYNPFSNTNDSAHAPQEDEDFVFEAFARTRLQQQT